MERIHRLRVSWKEKMEERQNRIARTVFEAKHLDDLKGAICDVIDIFTDVLNDGFIYGSYFTHADVLEKLHEVDESRWQQIRDTFLLDKFHGYKDGNFKEYEITAPSKLLMDIVNMIDSCHKTITTQLEKQKVLYQRIMDEKAKLEEELVESESKLLHEKRQYGKERVELSSLKELCRQQEALILEKNEEIADLQRDATVSLWDKQKKKVLAEADKRNTEQDMEIDRLVKQNRAISKRLTKAEDQLKLFKMKGEVSDLKEDRTDETEHLKRKTFLMEKDLLCLEQEFNRHQKIFAGLISGISTDISLLAGDNTDSEEMKSRKDVVNRLQQAMQIIYDASVQNNLLSLTEETLPVHYTVFDKEIKLQKAKRLWLGIEKSNTQNIPTSDTTIRESSDTESNGVAERTQDKDRKDSLRGYSNPLLVDPDTNKINSFIAKKCFPHMNEKFILSHWEKYKQYDRNGDGSLDYKEVFAALSTIRSDWDKSKVEIALMEVDLDRSNTLDFFEYMLVADKLVRKSGTSELYKTRLVSKDNKAVTKTCAIQ